MTNFGEKFRSARLQKGLELNEVAHALYIRESFLRALEEEQWTELPEEPYARGLVKNYASFLGLDVEESLAEFAQIHPGLNPSQTFTQLDEPIVDHGRSHRQTSHSIIGVIVGIAVLLAAWSAFAHFYLEINPFSVFRTAATPEPTTVPTSKPTTGVTPLSTTATTPTTRATATMTPDTMATPEDATAPVSVTIDAQAECWTEVIVDGETVFSGLLQPGASIAYMAETEIELS